MSSSITHSRSNKGGPKATVADKGVSGKIKGQASVEN